MLSRRGFISAIAALAASTALPSIAMTPCGPGLMSASVMDFGAVGDGVANDSGAFRAALAALAPIGTLFIPSGNYFMGNMTTACEFLSC